jgi:hypothetical protein
MAFANASVSDIIATTLESRSGKIADNVLKNNALLAYLKKSGKVKTVSGGSKILQELAFAENGNFGWYSGYDTLPVAPQDVISAAEFTLKQCAVPVVASGLELLQNAGPEAKIDLLESRIAVGEKTMMNKISEAIYGDGTGAGGKTLTGLDAMIVDDPTAAATYGGIAQNTWAFWRNRVLFTGAAFSSRTALPWMNKMWAGLVRGADRPGLILTGAAGWGDYIADLQNILRVTDTSSGDMGFPAVKFMTADFVLDGGIGGFANAAKMHFLNLNYLHWRPHKDRNMVPLTPGRRVAINQDAEVQILAFAGNLTCSGRQFQGVVRATSGTSYPNPF